MMFIQKFFRQKNTLKKTITRDIFSIAVTSSSYKLSSFDLIIAPAHDFRKRQLPKNVISISGFSSAQHPDS